MDFYYRGAYKVQFVESLNFGIALKCYTPNNTATTGKITPESVDCVSVQSEIHLDMSHYERTFETSLRKIKSVSIFFFVLCNATTLIQKEVF